MKIAKNRLSGQGVEDEVDVFSGRGQVIVCSVDDDFVHIRENNLRAKLFQRLNETIKQLRHEAIDDAVNERIAEEAVAVAT